MPQSSDELREEMGRRFGDPIGEEGPYGFLYAAGSLGLYVAWLGMTLP